MNATATTLADVVGDAVIDIASSATLREAAADLADNEVGALLVVRPNGARGLLSERDVVRAIADDVDPDEERVGNWCADDLVTLPPTASLGHAVSVMQGTNVRHLVVGDGEATRIVSLRAVVAMRDTVGV